MNLQIILDYLKQLIANNNRDWFNLHKDLYLEAKSVFETFTEQYINRMSLLEPELGALTPQECEWRIYRDTRFSPDKTPYKDHFGAFLAPHGGKRSPFAGYYIHLTPGGCMFASGVWGPDKDLLTALRQSVLDNYDELEDIFSAPAFLKYFSGFDTYYQLARTPLGFPRDFKHDDWLRLKAFTLTHHLTDKQVADPHFIDLLLDISAAAKPLNNFLNYTVEEVKG